MIKFKAWNASNSRAIAKFHNTEIGHFGHNAFIHELIRGPLRQVIESSEDIAPSNFMIVAGFLVNKPDVGQF